MERGEGARGIEPLSVESSVRPLPLPLLDSCGESVICLPEAYPCCCCPDMIWKFCAEEMESELGSCCIILYPDWV